MAQTLPFLLACTLTLLGCLSAHANPIGPARTPGAGVTTERPGTVSEADVGAQSQSATFGLCPTVQNPDDFASNPVPVQEDNCNRFQTFESHSPGPSTGGDCGGFTVAFGPLGDLKRDWTRMPIGVIRRSRRRDASRRV
jgi:hypothetical protein